MTHPEWLALLLDREITYRYDKKLVRRLRYARLRHQAAVEDVDYRAARGLDRALFQKLVAGEWIDAHDNLVITGPTGVGKSYLASALGHKACRDSRSVLYQRVPKLLRRSRSRPWRWALCTFAPCSGRRPGLDLGRLGARAAHRRCPA
jgi:DNA replication protein DnaC